MPVIVVSVLDGLDTVCINVIFPAVDLDKRVAVVYFVDFVTVFVIEREIYSRSGIFVRACTDSFKANAFEIPVYGISDRYVGIYILTNLYIIENVFHLINGKIYKPRFFRDKFNDCTCLFVSADDLNFNAVDIYIRHFYLRRIVKIYPHIQFFADLHDVGIKQSYIFDRYACRKRRIVDRNSLFAHAVAVVEIVTVFSSYRIQSAGIKSRYGIIFTF